MWHCRQQQDRPMQAGRFLRELMQHASEGMQHTRCACAYGPCISLISWHEK